jgi:PEP-CTERM motif/CHRD domain
VTSGSYDQTFDMTLASSDNPAFIAANGGTTAGAEAALFAAIAADEAYLTIHTTTFPDGAISGFLVALSVPEPSSLALAGAAAFCGVIYGWRRCDRPGSVTSPRRCAGTPPESMSSSPSWASYNCDWPCESWPPPSGT